MEAEADSPWLTSWGLSGFSTALGTRGDQTCHMLWRRTSGSSLSDMSELAGPWRQRHVSLSCVCFKT